MNGLPVVIKRYKIGHIIFWAWSYVELMHRQVGMPGALWQHMTDATITLLSEMIYVYFSVYYLIPRYLNKDKYITFGALSLAAVLSASLISTILQDVYIFVSSGELIGNFLFLTFIQSVDIVLKTTIFIAIVIIADRYNNYQLKRRLEKEKLETELRFLKSQINPHFLFNALNSIYVLIDVDKEVATSTLLQFSDLLRYQLYECSGSTVNIKKEFDFLDDYIKLEKLRKSANLTINTELTVTAPFNIAPFLLMPFIENAFKHVSGEKQEQNFISICGRSNEDGVSLLVTNTMRRSKTRSNINESGIGLHNVMRRLELLYPDSHKLEILQLEGTYTVNLMIYAKDN